MTPLIATLLVVSKTALTALAVICSTLAAERLRPVWAGIITAVPVSAGAAFIMLALQEPASFVAQAGLASAVTGLAAFAYIVVFVKLAPRWTPLPAIAVALAVWIAVNRLTHVLSWTAPGISISLGLAYLGCRYFTQGSSIENASPARARIVLAELAFRGLAVAALAFVVTFAARHFGSVIAGMMAAFPIVFLTVSYIVHRQLDGAAAAATIAGTAASLLGVANAFLVIYLLAEKTGSAVAIAIFFAAAVGWQVALALYQLRAMRRGFSPNTHHQRPGLNS